MNTAQVSLEFLLICAAFFGLLALSIQAFDAVYSNALFALDLMQARDFADAVSGKSALLQALGNHSRESISAFPVFEWKIRLSDVQVLVEVRGPGQTRRITRALSLAAVPFEASFSQAFELELERNDSLLYVHR